MRKFLGFPVLVLVVVCGLAGRVEARQKFVEGVFTAAETGEPLELIAWAEAGRGGVLKMAHGFLEDAPVLPRTYRFLVNVSGYNMAAVLAANQDVFKLPFDRIESRTLAFSNTKLNIRTTEVGIPDLEDADAIVRLQKDVKATGDKLAVFFLVLNNGAITRYYPFFIDRD